MSLDQLASKYEEQQADPDRWEAPEEVPGMVTVTWRGKEWVGDLRVMSPEEELTRDRLLARWIGAVNVAAFPNYGYWQALATIRTMWPSLPRWMDWFLTHEKNAAVALAMKVDDYEATFREKHVGPGAADSGKAGFSISSTVDEITAAALGDAK